jgi:enterochelin esterase-like enzyme/uncharacterized damage-inducible protein DinB
MDVLPASLLATTAPTLVRDEALNSHYLERLVVLDVLLPPGFNAAATTPYPVLYLNDGQDLAALRLPDTLATLYRMGAVLPFVVVAIHASDLRVQEYGIAGQPDYRERGSRAGLYTEFMLKELLPYAQRYYRVSASPQEAVVAGFSLGGLMAFDLSWQHPARFARAGVFSGSFWWRDHALGAGYTEAARLAHRRVRAGQLHPGHRFWLQTGTLDEVNDRNGNGVIDAVDDTLDLILELQRQGLDPATQLRYVQVEGGRHHADTWGRVLPDFLLWAFGNPEAGARLLSAPLPVVRKQFHLLHSQPDSGHTAPTAATLVPAIHLTAPLTSPHMQPSETEYASFYAGYVGRVPEGANPLAMLSQQSGQLRALLSGISEEQAAQGYAESKWSLKELLLHMADAERVFAYRALRFGRGDGQALPGFDENTYAAASGANARSLADLLDEYEAVRAASIALFSSFTAAQLALTGIANGQSVSVRALLYILTGHELHHMHIIQERYLPRLQPAGVQHAS